MPPLTQQQLVDVMVYQLEALKMSSDTVNADTVIGAIVSENALVPGVPSSAKLFQDFVRFSLSAAGNTLKKWPADWLTRTPNTLSPDLL